MSTELYEGDFNRKFAFNDVVECTCTLLPRSMRVGRLVQVRKGVGQFGSDVFILRLAGGDLASFANVGLQHASDSIPDAVGDSEETEYTIGKEFPETGFVIHKPSQPKDESGMFAITITRSE